MVCRAWEGLCVQISHQLVEEALASTSCGACTCSSLKFPIWVCVNPVQDKIRPAGPYIADGAGVAKKSLECKPTVEAQEREESKQDRRWNGHQT